MDIADTDPTRRTAGQYARETVMRMRMRTLVALGVRAQQQADVTGGGGGSFDHYQASMLVGSILGGWI